MGDRLDIYVHGNRVISGVLRLSFHLCEYVLREVHYGTGTRVGK